MLLRKSLSAAGDGAGFSDGEGPRAGDGLGTRSEGGGAGGECKGDSTGELTGAWGNGVGEDSGGKFAADSGDGDGGTSSVCSKEKATFIKRRQQQ